MRNDRRLIRTINSLKEQNIDKNKYEIIVVENGSYIFKNYPFSKEIIYFHIEEANMPKARNKGLEIAKGKYVLFTDADCVPDREWLKNILKRLSVGDVFGVGGRIERYDPITIVQKYGSNIVNGQKSLNYLPILKYPYIAGANCGYQKEILISIGGFDEKLLSGNDVDVCYKAGLLGYKIGLTPEAIIYHENRKTIFDHFKRFFNYSQYQVLLYKKYRHISKWIILNPYSAKLIIKSLMKLPSGVFDCFFMKPKILFSSILNIVEAVGVFSGNIYGSLKYKVPYF